MVDRLVSGEPYSVAARLLVVGDPFWTMVGHLGMTPAPLEFSSRSGAGVDPETRDARDGHVHFDVSEEP